jgi:uncharacterized membrane protein YfcA
MDHYDSWLPVVLALAASGAVGGFIAGLLGVGGGIVVVPALDFALQSVGYSHDAALHVAVATSVATIIPTGLSSSRSHSRRDAVDTDIVRRWTLPIVAGALAGAVAASHLDGRMLAAVFGSVALAAGLKMLLPLEGLVLHDGVPRGIAGALLAAVIGAVSSMMGIGGGTLSVPTMTLCGEPVHKAVGTASLLGLSIAVPATLAYLLARPQGNEALPPFTVGYVSLLGLAVVAPLSWGLAPLGARVAHALDRRTLAATFGCFLLLVAVRMGRRALG